MPDEDKITEPQSQDPTPSPQPEPAPDVEKLMSALSKEREARKALEQEQKARTQREKELQDALEKYKAVDPQKYERLIKEQAEREEQDLLKRKEFDKLQAQYRAETEAARKESTEWRVRHDNLVVETAVKSAFYDNGGRKSSFDLSSQGAEDVAPVEAILSILRNKVQLQDGKVVLINSVGSVELNSEGRPKTLTEKMLELKKGSMGSLFEPENNHSGSGMTPTLTQNGKQVKVYTREQARNGKVSIDEIASGRAIIN